MDKKIKPRVRLVIIKNKKLLLTYTKDGDFYFYIGGKMEFGETLEQACLREIKEECGKDVDFILKRFFISGIILSLKKMSIVSSFIF